MFSKDFNKKVDELMHRLDIQISNDPIVPLNGEYVTIKDLNNYDGNISGIIVEGWSNIVFYK